MPSATIPSPADRATLASILDPAAPSPIHPADLARFLDRPEIQAAIAAHIRIREIRLSIQLAEASTLALGSLRALLETRPDLKDPIARTEVRRAASSILRFRHPAPSPPSLHHHLSPLQSLSHPTPSPSHSAPPHPGRAAIPGAPRAAVSPDPSLPQPPQPPTSRAESPARTDPTPRRTRPLPPDPSSDPFTNARGPAARLLTLAGAAPDTS